MKRISTKKNGFFKRFLINIPFILIVLFAVVMFGGAAFSLFYSVVLFIAFKSPMIFLIVFGAGALLLGIGLLFIVAFKKYHAFYDKSMGWVYENEQKPQKTEAYDNKKTLKSYFSLTNVAFGVLLIGALAAIISAPLGSVERENWIKSIGPYREAHGFYADVHRFEPPCDNYFIPGRTESQMPIDTVEIDLDTKEAVIVYSTDMVNSQFIVVKGYVQFGTPLYNKDQLVLSRSKDGRTVYLTENPPPEFEEKLIDKLLFFIGDILDNYPVEKQVMIYIPVEYKDKIEIVGEHIVAKEKL